MHDIRIRFRKEGTARYISHLDINRTMTRALRRAALPIWYTEGFHRHPYVSFAMPLALGYESVCECMDLRLTEQLPMQEVLDRLNAVLPVGLEAYAAGEPVYKAAAIALARYRVSVAVPCAVWEAFAAQPTVTAQKRTKKGTTKTVELTPFVQKASAAEGESGLILDLTLPCSPAGSLAPSLVTDALGAHMRETTGESLPAPRICRLTLLTADGTPFA